jgi:two-component system, chemotaxis family, protein-glutamate methylesterase/glutaminase
MSGPRRPIESQATERCFVAIGASGKEGLDDIKALLAALRRPVPAVVLVVLHRPADRISALREILARSSHMPVVVAANGEKFETDTCYIGEPDEHITLASRSFAHLVEHRAADRNRTIDLLFKSIAQHAKRRMIGVVLSGSLDDGSRGLAAIKEAGGTIMVLTSANRAARGMPENARDFDGPIDVIGTPEQIAQAIGGALSELAHASKAEP